MRTLSNDIYDTHNESTALVNDKRQTEAGISLLER